MSDGERCGHPRVGEDPCGSAIGLCDDCGHCWQHCDHVSEEERAEARRKGGQTTAEKRRDGPRKLEAGELPGEPPETARDAKMWSAWAMYAVASGKIGEKQAHEVGYLVRAFLQSLQKAEIDERIEELEDEIRRLQGDPELKAV